MEKRTTATTTTRTTKTIELTGADIIDMLNVTHGLDIPADAGVNFRVPLGGAWSGVRLSIDEANPVTVTYRETEVTTDGI